MEYPNVASAYRSLVADRDRADAEKFRAMAGDRRGVSVGRTIAETVTADGADGFGAVLLREYRHWVDARCRILADEEAGRPVTSDWSDSDDAATDLLADFAEYVRTLIGE
jgi:hypothetical protein